MSPSDAVLLVLAVLLAVSVLARLMQRRRDLLVGQVQKQLDEARARAAEAKKKQRDAA